MSEEDDKKPVIEVTEESWEEDTGEVDVSELEEALNRLEMAPDSLPSGGADTQRSGELKREPLSDHVPQTLGTDPSSEAAKGEESPAHDAAMNDEVATPLDLEPRAPGDVPLDEELSESLRPILPPSPLIHPVGHTVVSTPVITDSEPPPSISSVFQDLSGTPPSLSVGQHFARARRIGTGIWFAGVFLWAYLVVGELVVGAGLPEAFGWSAFVGVVVGAFLHGANRIGTRDMRKMAALSAGADIVGVLLLSSLIGSTRRSEYQALSFGFLLIAVGLVFWGLRFARGGLPRIQRSPGINWPRLVVWVLFVGPTLLIGAVLLS